MKEDRFFTFEELSNMRLPDLDDQIKHLTDAIEEARNEKYRLIGHILWLQNELRKEARK